MAYLRDDVLDESLVPRPDISHLVARLLDEVVEEGVEGLDAVEDARWRVVNASQDDEDLFLDCGFDQVEQLRFRENSVCGWGLVNLVLPVLVGGVFELKLSDWVLRVEFADWLQIQFLEKNFRLILIQSA